MKIHYIPALFQLLFLTGIFANEKSKIKFTLPDAIGGEKNGWFDAKNLPTSIKINDEWVLPRGGTMEWLMTKGYVPHPKKKNIMVPNPFDKRYKVPRTIIQPSLATNPLEHFYVPKQVKSNDPFAGLADPMKRKYSPIPGVGANPGNNKEAPLGPVLEPDLPELKNSPFDAPEKNFPNLPIAPNVKKDPFNQNPNKRLPPNDPFANDVINEPIQKPTDPNQILPGKKIESLKPNEINNTIIKPNA